MAVTLSGFCAVRAVIAVVPKTPLAVMPIILADDATLHHARPGLPDTSLGLLDARH